MPSPTASARFHGRAPAVAVPRPSSRADHVRALFVQTPVSLAANLLGMAVVAGMYGPLAHGGRLVGWFVLALCLWLLRAAHYQRFRRQPEVDDRTLLGWRHGWRALALAQGAVWGLAVWMFWGLGSPYHGLALILIVYSYTLGSVQLLASQPGVFLAFISLVLLPTILRVASDSTQPYHWQLAGILCLLFGMTVLMGRSYRGALGQAIRLKQRTEQLAAQLQVEKAAAEQARQSAEAANRAKTQFFAAASHDLRQPLHAMGLFAEALRQRSHDAQGAALVNSINESVDALDGLFGELLDITRIDSGGVEVHAQPVPLKDVFARLRLHFEPTAFEKGLALHFHGARHVAHSDPVILERILRNLVSNAIRYSEDGGVLVSCRSRAGRLRIQVWDSGVGIAPDVLPRIFDEFYQVEREQPPNEHQRKGLGLGLAIVQRLALLIGTSITVRSTVGRGSVFGFEVPAGTLRASEPAQAVPRQPPGLTLDGRCVLIVEDDRAVREGLEVLLKAWGAAVIAFDSVAATQAAVAGGEALPRPDLLIVDHRLPGGCSGLDALAVLRARWPETRLPAIVVTGSSLVGHEDEASRHDFHVLVKPVLPNRLRAMIAFKLAGR